MSNSITDSPAGQATPICLGPDRLGAERDAIRAKMLARSIANEDDRRRLQEIDAHRLALESVCGVPDAVEVSCRLVGLGDGRGTVTAVRRTLCTVKLADKLVSLPIDRVTVVDAPRSIRQHYGRRLRQDLDQLCSALRALTRTLHAMDNSGDWSGAVELCDQAGELLIGLEALTERMESQL